MPGGSRCKQGSPAPRRCIVRQQLMATRMRALYADSAAPKAQLDAAEAGLARASAGVSARARGRGGDQRDLRLRRGARAVCRHGHAALRRCGGLRRPRAPLVTVQDNSTLRIAATVAPEVAAGVKRGAAVTVTVEGVRGDRDGRRCRAGTWRKPLHGQRDREEPRRQALGRWRLTPAGGDGDAADAARPGLGAASRGRPDRGDRGAAAA